VVAILPAKGNWCDSKEPLRTVSDDERAVLGHLSRSAREQAAVVARAKAVLAVADGASFCRGTGRRAASGAVGRLVARFNAERLTPWSHGTVGARRSIQVPASGSSVRLDASRQERDDHLILLVLGDLAGPAPRPTDCRR
jgi:hypothetical protein